MLAYHDVVDNSSALTYDAITLRNLAVQLDWLRQNGYRVVSVDDVVAAQQGQRPLPPKAVLLTFDDGYRSFYTHVYPLLRAFDYPAVLSVVGSFLDVPPGHRSVSDGPGRPGRLRQLGAVARDAALRARGDRVAHLWPSHHRLHESPRRRDSRRDRTRVHPAAAGPADQRSGTASRCPSPASETSGRS